jgi:hypothetical protein
LLFIAGVVVVLALIALSFLFIPSAPAPRPRAEKPAQDEVVFVLETAPAATEATTEAAKDPAGAKPR